MSRTNRSAAFHTAGNDFRNAFFQSLTDFLVNNRRLLIFLLLFLCGVVGGIWVFISSHSFLSKELKTILNLETVTGGFSGGIGILFSSCLSTFILLALLFLSGLSACGAPMTAIVPFFFGMGLGLTESFYYGSGSSGILFVVLLVIPHNLLSIVALVMGCSESLRMTLLLGGQLLPGAHLGGLWQDFKLYTVRFLICTGITFAAGIVDVCFRMAFLSMFA
jgi:hypothetical protein